MGSTYYYNNTVFTITPSAGTYQHVVTSLATTDPSGGSYDYQVAFTLDLNTIIKDVTINRPLNANQQFAIAGESTAWAALHAAMNTGTGIDSATTTMSDGDTNTLDTTWYTFWSGIISQAIDNDDKDGLSVIQSALSTRLGNATQTSSADNDILHGINSAFGSSFGTQTIGSPPDANTNFWAALLVFLYHAGGASNLTGDPSDGAVGTSFSAGDGIAIRMSVNVNNTMTGLIKLTQAAASGGGA